MELKVPIDGGRLNRASISIAKHPVACHFDVEDMLHAVSEAVWQDPFNPISTGQTLQRASIFGPNQTFVVSIPVELESLFLPQSLGDSELDPKPVSGPAGTKRGTSPRRLELILRRLLKSWPFQVWHGVDGKLDMVFIVNGCVVIFPASRRTLDKRLVWTST